MASNKFLAAALLAIASVLSPARAALTTYDLILSIDAITVARPCGGIIAPPFGCLLSVGDTFSGRFSVDSSILATDGLNQTASIFDFFLPFGTAIYSTGPDNTALRGFRNPAFASAPGFLIENGQVVDWVGGVFGAGDVPFIDMHNPALSNVLPRNRFLAFDGATQATGSLTVVTPVPEPETLAMWLGGILVVGLALCRSKPKAG